LFGVDYGIKKIGFAISDPDLVISFPHSTIKNDDNLIKTLYNIIVSNGVRAVVIGLPKTLNRGLHAIGADVKKIAHVIECMKIPVLLWDETMSTCGAMRKITSVTKWDTTKGKKRKNFGHYERNLAKDDDKHAASYVMQEVMDIISTRYKCC